MPAAGHHVTQQAQATAAQELILDLADASISTPPKLLAELHSSCGVPNGSLLLLNVALAHNRTNAPALR